MSVLEAAEYFKNYPKILKRLNLLKEVGLDYIKLGQPSTTLSGGEAQRIKTGKRTLETWSKQLVYLR